MHMSHTDEVLAEIVAANERVCQARSAMNLAKAEASARTKAYAEAVDNLSLAIPMPGRESPTPLLDQAKAEQAETDQGERLCGGPPEPDYLPPFTEDEPAVTSRAEADQEIYDEVKPRPRRRRRKTGRKVTKKRSKTDAN
jgi:hypothetical protein